MNPARKRKKLVNTYTRTQKRVRPDTTARATCLVRGPTKPFGHKFLQCQTTRGILGNTDDWTGYCVAKDATVYFYVFLLEQKPLETHLDMGALLDLVPKS
jgi:hypothetical protein